MHRHESVQEVGGVRRKGDNPGDLSGAYEWNIPKAKNEEHCIRKARLRLPFSGAFRKPVMERLEQGLLRYWRDSNENEIVKLLKRGESETLEFKKSTAQLDKALKSICAFLNHKGGTIYFGIEENRKVVGQGVSDKTMKSISQKIRQRIKPEISPEIKVLEIKGKEVIEVKVKEGSNKPYYLDGIAYKRVGTENVVIAPEELERIIIEKRKKYWNSEICEEASLNDIDEEKVRRFLRKAKYERNFDVEPEIPIKEALEKLELMKNGKLTNAAILLFGKNPQKFFLQAETRCARFKGTKPIEFTDMKVFQGSIIEQVEKKH